MWICMLQVSWRGRTTHQYSANGQGIRGWWSCMIDTFTGVLTTDTWIEHVLTLGFFPFMIHDVFWNSLLKCQLTMESGIHPSSRARAILFLTSTLQKKATAYPAIGQKKLNGAASRMMIHFGKVMSDEIQKSHPSDVHRQVKFRLPPICCGNHFHG